ncbi:Uncharacterised protein [Lelliottia amnigena]|nr:Uncharacterised protein [Lelliottia amnigena]
MIRNAQESRHRANGPSIPVIITQLFTHFFIQIVKAKLLVGAD